MRKKIDAILKLASSSADDSCRIKRPIRYCRLARPAVHQVINRFTYSPRIRLVNSKSGARSSFRECPVC